MPDFIKKWVSYGASVRAPQHLLLGEGAGADARPLPRQLRDIRALAKPVLRHRIPATSTRVGAHHDRPALDQCSRSCRAQVEDVGEAPGAVMNALDARQTRARASSIRTCWRDPNLELLARVGRRGFINGLHRSPNLVRRGLRRARAYMRAMTSPDRWRLYAGATLLHQGFEPTNANFSVLVDVSKSMSSRAGRTDVERTTRSTSLRAWSISRASSATASAS